MIQVDNTIEEVISITQKEILILMSYIYNIRCHSENELREIRKHVRYGNADVVDCSELASAIVRNDTIHEITENF